MNEIFNKKKLISKAQDKIASPNLISSKKMEYPVVDTYEKKLGKMNEILIDLVGKEIAFGILRIGKSESLLSSQFAIPWEMLTYQSDKGNFKLKYERDEDEEDMNSFITSFPLYQPEM